MRIIYLTSIFFILLVGIQVNAQTSLKKAFNDSQKDYNGIYTVLNIEETEENILKFAKKNDIVVLAVVNAQETTQYGEVYIPVTSFKYIKPLEFAEIQKRNNIQKQINSENELASIALFAALAYGTYKAVGYGAEYVIKGMVKAGVEFKGNQSSKSTYKSSSSDDSDIQKYITGDFECPEYKRSNDDCRNYNTMLPRYEFVICEYKIKDIDGSYIVGEIYQNQETKRYCIRHWDLLSHYCYYNTLKETIKALYVRIKFERNMDGYKDY